MLATIRNTALLATLAAAAIAAAPAQAASLHETQRSIAVDHTDLNLASAEGAAALQARVRRAAKTVCGTADTRDLAAMRARTDCRAGALQTARPRMEVAIANARSNVRMASADQAIVVATH